MMDAKEALEAMRDSHLSSDAQEALAVLRSAVEERDRLAAELAEARPLLEAVMECPPAILKNLPQSGFSDLSPKTWTGSILHAALAYRAKKEA